MKRTTYFVSICLLVLTGCLNARGQVKDYATDDRLSPGVRTFLATLNTGGPGLETLSPVQARQVLVDIQKTYPVDLSGVSISEKTIKVNGQDLVLNIVRPAGAKGELPVFIYIHGGGWVLGDFPTHRHMVRNLAVLSGYVGVFVNYTRTPDAAYPTQIDQIYAATQWVATHGSEIGVNGKKLAVVGNSVGGNMTAVTAIKAKENNGPRISVQIMMWPILDHNFETESYREFGDQRFLSTPVMKWMYNMYIPDDAKRDDIHASPLHATTDQLKGLPPALILVAENDILRDDGEAYGRKLEQAGVTVTTVRYNGVIHDWGLLTGLAKLPQTEALFEQAALELKKYLK
ncbi:alpha/beta hydrolase [Flavitalea sp. BT771]|uniref:alpha/beta hydrolase n=1 Tax=Flavitalea sp. BT771 TaxID=3063329 RepID=UPI0026E36F41|nr:alpha/beta hydrolase [Flavitalea sp. BT771]MDO6431156.1 alpha/beta hydrolase [Flavitalea sp. BT771]MDV6220063.1 alpha/beta hydrolase [Flavitalea sp. BT771]